MLGELLVVTERQKWADVPAEALALAQRCKWAAADVQALAREFPGELIDAWLEPLDNHLTFNFTKAAEPSAWHDRLRDLPYDRFSFSVGLEDYRAPLSAENPQWNIPAVKIAMRPYVVVGYQEKQAYSPTVRALGALGGWNADLLHTPEWPSPASAMLASGLLGAGAGYGIGALGEHFLPDDWDKQKMKRNMALLGALAGAAPGALWGGVNIANGKGLLSHWPLESQLPDAETQALPFDKQSYFGYDGDENDTPSMLSPFQGVRQPEINVHEFNQTIWHDPVVSVQLTPQVQALATGLITGASHLAGEGTPATLISPWDVAKMTAGMGTGYASGALVGKALGALMGMPADTQEKLKQTGMWAGAVANFIPLAFGS